MALERCMAARSEARVLPIGESGTGKELLAAHIHQNGPFAAGLIVKANCGRHSHRIDRNRIVRRRERRFHRRGRGASQAELPRVLQEGEFHRVGGEQVIRVAVRVISATNRDLSALVAQSNSAKICITG